MKALYDRQTYLQAHGCELLIFGASAALFAFGYAVCCRFEHWGLGAGIALMAYAYYDDFFALDSQSRVPAFSSRRSSAVMPSGSKR